MSRHTPPRGKRCARHNVSIPRLFVFCLRRNGGRVLPRRLLTFLAFFFIFFFREWRNTKSCFSSRSSFPSRYCVDISGKSPEPPTRAPSRRSVVCQCPELSRCFYNDLVYFRNTKKKMHMFFFSWLFLFVLMLLCVLPSILRCWCVYF